MNQQPAHPSRRRGRLPAGSQRGVTLIAILIMMLALAFLALGAMGGSVLQERMAGNTRDRNVALQAAEAALRDAETDIRNNIDQSTPFSLGCTNGLCIPPSMAANGPVSTPVWQTIDWATQSRAYGSRTGAAALLGPDNQALASPPAYIIEQLPVMPPSPGDSACSSCAMPLTGQPYRITVRASGARSTTVVMLQSTYVKQ